jgi:hypothetical protein
MEKNEVIFADIDLDFWCEVKYLANVIHFLNEKIENYSIVVTHNLYDLPETKYKKIVILTGDETYRLGLMPYKSHDVLCVFRIFNNHNSFDNNFIYPIPTGYNWTMHNDRSKKMKRFYNEKKLSEREYDIFFSGQRLNNRETLFNNLSKINDSFKIYSNINNGFRKGIEIDEYYKLLGNCKISLVPDGTSIDTFRYVESFASGCIVITTKKDNIWYYEDSPAFFINSWDELNESLILDILKNCDLENFKNKNDEYYEKKLSEYSVANYMFEKIKSHEIN